MTVATSASDSAILFPHCPDGLVFDEVAHKYYFNGELVDGTTSILDVINKPALNEWRARVGPAAAEAKMRQAAAFGTRVHKALEQDCLDQEPEITDAAVIPFLQAWRCWRAAKVERIIYAERPVYNGKLRSAGTADLLAFLYGYSKPWLIDWKTGNWFSETWKIQTAAYRDALIWEGWDMGHRMCLQLPSAQPGTLKEHPMLRDDADSAAWRAALYLHRYLDFGAKK